ncbi:hypothetical protein KGQ20_13620 [Catenulispora sp. NF23]|uniref:Uncharacterized protein n=1 Tax=Catenulispora pinistramenti TaxID=2705254 RepID=A0ABS5L6K8_9ACTN|nr:hypothetical protein [Catenulispora pinistramenti]MBS2533808.1 hypothetical protein [Catenulispora pinistramenti]MBS2553983.1 hypothetical protein [Catenulispora pinistramenti]
MTVTLTISGLPKASVPGIDLTGIDLAGVARTLRPLLTPALAGVAELAGLGPLVPILLTIVAKATATSGPKEVVA